MSLICWCHFPGSWRFVWGTQSIVIPQKDTGLDQPSTHGHMSTVHCAKPEASLDTVVMAQRHPQHSVGAAETLQALDNTGGARRR